MNNQSEIRQKFVQAQNQIGINKDLFTKKFVYSKENINDSFLLDRFKPTPSQMQDFSIQQQKCAVYLMSQLIFKAGQSLKLPVSTTVVAAAITHYFYSRVGLLDHDFRDVVMGAMFLACKSQQTLRKSYEVSSVFDYIFKVFEGQRMPVKAHSLNSEEYTFMKQKLLKMQTQILFELGFEVYRLFDIPHRYIGGLFKSFDRHARCKQICQKAWTCLNDFYRTPCCLYYPGQTIAAAAIHYAFIKLNIPLPNVPWWVLMEANIDSIQELIAQLENFYETAATNKYSMEKVAEHMNQVGQKNGLINVFPVNYYRKIILEKTGELKTKKVVVEVLPDITIQPQPQIKRYQQEKPEIEQEDQKEDRNRKHKKSKKHKKKKDKKHKKHRSRSRSSRSRSRDHRDKKRDRQGSPKPEMSWVLLGSPQAKQQVQLVNSQNKIKQQESQQKQEIKDAKTAGTKGLLSMINSQLKRHQNRMKNQNSISKDENNHSLKQTLNNNKQPAQSDSDEQLMAELLSIKKQNKNKKDEE